MREHVSHIARTCYLHLRRLRAVRRQLGCDITAMLIAALVLTRIDYCNAVLAHLPAVTLRPLRKVLNASVRVALGLKPWDRVTADMLKNLHWLPLEQRIQYKLCLLTHLSITGQAPAYLSDQVHRASCNLRRQSLRSTDHGDLLVPKSKLKLGERAFEIAGPSAFNRLPAELKLATNTDYFKKGLKTFLFEQAFDS